MTLFSDYFIILRKWPNTKNQNNYNNSENTFSTSRFGKIIWVELAKAECRQFAADDNFLNIEALAHIVSYHYDS